MLLAFLFSRLQLTVWSLETGCQDHFASLGWCFACSALTWGNLSTTTCIYWSCPGGSCLFCRLLQLQQSCSGSLEGFFCWLGSLRFQVSSSFISSAAEDYRHHAQIIMLHTRKLYCYNPRGNFPIWSSERKRLLLMLIWTIFKWCLSSENDSAANT